MTEATMAAVRMVSLWKGREAGEERVDELLAGELRVIEWSRWSVHKWMTEPANW